MEVLELDIVGLATGGYGLARSPAGTLLVAGALPGERVRARVTYRTRAWTLAETIKVLHSSPDRTDPLCPHFGRCGGCDWQYVDYPSQVVLKEQVLRDCLRRQGGIEMALDPAISGTAFGYRHRSRLHLAPRGSVGFRAKRSHAVVDIEDCPVLCDRLRELVRRLNEVRFRVREVTELHASSDGREIAIQVKNWPGGHLEAFRKETGACGVQAGARRVGNPRITLKLGTIRYEVRAGRFFQSNWTLNHRLVEEVCRLVPQKGSVLDLYAGAGNFSLPLAARGTPVTAVESVSGLLEDGMRNAEANGLENIRFVKADLEKEPLRLREFADAVVADPPRSGLSRGVVNWLLDRKPGVFVYVSCDPATFARDLGRLKAGFSIESIQLVDLFPQTSHMESVALLRAMGGRPGRASEAARPSPGGGGSGRKGRRR